MFRPPHPKHSIQVLAEEIPPYLNHQNSEIMKFRVIKSKAFDTNGVKGKSYTVAHKGRAMNVSTLSFEEGAIKEEGEADKQTITIEGDLVLVKSPYTNELDEAIQGLKLMPKLDLQIED